MGVKVLRENAHESVHPLRLSRRLILTALQVIRM